MSGIVPLAWRPRRSPLAPLAAVAEGAAARRLRDRLLAASDAELAELRGAAVADAICVLGDERALPWVDGIEYLGLDALAPRFFVPTALEPTHHIALVARAWERAAGPECPPPRAVLRQSRRLVSTANARPLARRYLERWGAT